jgi:carbon storage regulator
MMTILARRERDSIRIGADVTVTIISIKGGAARIGIDAPKEMPVQREETVGDHREQTDSPSSPRGD